VDESTVKQYKSDLTDEVEPAINELIERAEQGLRHLYKKESMLQAKVNVLDLICSVVTPFKRFTKGRIRTINTTTIYVRDNGFE